jgi:hypothetical protein
VTEFFAARISGIKILRAKLLGQQNTTALETVERVSARLMITKDPQSRGAWILSR